MKARYLTAVGLAAALAVAGCSSSKNTGSGSSTSPTAGGSSSSAPSAAPSSSGGGGSSDSGTLTVWLQTDAQTGWPKEVQAATDAFNKKYPNVKVDVQYQTWGDHLTKLDAALAATPPDVVELGNTETTKYMAAGALADLSNDKAKFDTSDSWLKGLADSVTYQGKIYGVPYYAGARGVIYRTDQFQAVGITAPPTTLDELKADGDKLKAKYGSNPNYSALYWPGKNWYGAMSFVYGYGGNIATSDGGKWTANLESPEAQAGLTELKSLVDDLSKAPKDGDESKQDSVMAQGNVGMIYGNGWEVGSVTAPKDKGGNPDLKVDGFPLPGKDASKPLPSFLGGSDLVIPAASKNTAWAEEWINDFTGKDGMTALVNDAKVIPNTTSLLTLPAIADSAFTKAAQESWFVPTAPNWADVESQNVLQTMLANIMTGKQSIADATKAADQQIDSILNKS
ncbi:MAG TPA: sugar ABC transporter substrate-binding protein [Acidothermaceae bacterium]|nr:sugar ABC transporter substrate-binding protein [Acidothermaceae bacterium]